MEEKTTKSIVGFENKGIFPAIDSRYKFEIVVFKNSGVTESLRGIFGLNDLDILRRIRNDNGEDPLLDIPKQVLADYSPIAGIFPIVRSQEQVNSLKTIVEHKQISEPVDGSWYATPYAELHRTSDTDRFFEDEEDGDYPVLGGSNIHQFTYDNSVWDLNDVEFWSVEGDSNRSAKQRIREKQARRLKSELYDFVERSEEVTRELDVQAGRSKKGTVNELLEAARDKPLSEDDVKLDCEEYRIVFRDVAQPTDERTLIAAVIPPNTVCHNKLHTVRPYEINPEIDDLRDDQIHGVYDGIFTNKELFTALGLMNSIPFDYLMRTKVDKSVVMYKFKQIWEPAAKLNCYGEEFREMRHRLDDIDEISPTDKEARSEAQASLDAAAFHAYGFEHEEVEFVLEDFHRVRDPKIMTEQYLENVLTKFDQWD
jgi:hypothetical protein